MAPTRKRLGGSDPWDLPHHSESQAAHPARWQRFAVCPRKHISSHVPCIPGAFIRLSLSPLYTLSLSLSLTHTHTHTHTHTRPYPPPISTTVSSPWVRWQRICLPMRETRVRFPGPERSPGGGKWQPHSRILAWRIPWTEESGRASVHGIADLERTEGLTHPLHI